MENEDVIFVGVCDLAGHMRGKAFPAADLESRLRKGMGYTGSNIMMSAFGPIYDSPFGTQGDLTLIPDPATKVDVGFEGFAPERFYLADIRTPDGKPWSCCPRDFLRRAVEELQREAGLQVVSAFEQEFVYTGVDAARPGTTYGYDTFRHQGLFGEAFVSAIRRAGVKPDSFLPEYGPRQFEVTVAPAAGMRAADEAVIVREMARAVAFRLGHRVIFSPVVDLNQVGNGTHIHFSLCDAAGLPVMHDPSRPYGLSQAAEPFVAGILRHLPAIAALTAPSVVSYLRLRPNRWAPVWTNLAERDRGASLRVCPVFDTALEDAARQFNVEFRVCDATASPYMALGAVVHAGLDGIRKGMGLGAPPSKSFWQMTDEERRALGLEPLPGSLEQALDLLKADETVCGWLGPELLDAYLRLKRSEIGAVKGQSDEAICARYADAY
ncbi:glutamine synthetase [Rhizobiales bacterium GAS188]|nr:glutamine synthetase [Rhizobiales bacterium GAS188]